MSIISKYEAMSLHSYEINIQADKLISSAPTTQNKFIYISYINVAYIYKKFKVVKLVLITYPDSHMQ